MSQKQEIKNRLAQQVELMSEAARRTEALNDARGLAELGKAMAACAETYMHMSYADLPMTENYVSFSDSKEERTE